MTPEPSEFWMRSRGMPKALAEQLPEERIVEERRHGLLDPVLHIDVDHGGSGALHHRGKRLLDRDLALGDGAPLRHGRQCSNHYNLPDHEGRYARST